MNTKKAERDAIDKHLYLLRSIQSNQSYLEHVGDADARRLAEIELFNVKPGQDGFLGRLDRWVDLYLTKQKRDNMLAALRQARRRRSGVGKSITISAKAHYMLSMLSEKDGLTFSETIEKRFAAACRAESERLR